MGSAVPAWVQTALAVASWGLVIGAWLLIVVWARGKRGPGARWCGKCLYDMTGLPGMKCPECGREAKHERQLQRRKRRWSALVVALVLIALNYAMWVPGRLSQGEPWRTALVPTGALVVGLPWVARERAGPTTEFPGMSFTTQRMPPWDPAMELLFDRIRRDELSAWHWEAVGQIGLLQHPRTLNDRYLPVLPTRDSGVREVLELGLGRGAFREGLKRRIEGWANLVVNTRDVWPQGSLVHVVVDAHAWNTDRLGIELRDASGKSVEGAMIARDFPSVYVRFDGVPPPGERRRYTLRLVRVPRDGSAASLIRQQEFQVVGAEESSEEFLEAVSLPAEKLLLGAYRKQERAELGGPSGAQLVRPSGWTSWPPWDRPELLPRLEALQVQGLTFAAWVDVYCGEELCMSGTAVFPARPSAGHREASSRERWLEGLRLQEVRLPPENLDGPWRMVLKGDAGVALLDFECRKYWKGEATLELPYGVEMQEEK